MAGKQWREFVFETKRQKAPNTGKAEKGVVRKISDGKTYSKPPDVMRVTIKPMQ